MSFLKPDTEKYEQMDPEERKYEARRRITRMMDPEERKYEARRRITRMIAIRIAMAVMLLWVIFRFDLPGAMIVVLAVVIVLLLGTLAPVIRVLQTTLQYEDEKEEE